MNNADFQSLHDTLAGVPPGRWGVGISGGADSVALLRLATGHADLQLHVLHLDHETRGEASTGDSRFVSELAASMQVAATVRTRSEVEGSLDNPERAALPANRSARFRSLRLALYRRAVEEQQLRGVLLAHHADDQAETVLLRLIRGGSFTSLSGMAERTTVGGVMLLRPLLAIAQSALRDYLRAIGQSWREDASNASENQARNRVRKVLAKRTALTTRLTEIAAMCRQLRQWAASHSPGLAEQFAVRSVSSLPEILATAALGDWLRQGGVSAEDISSDHLRELFTLCTDAASPARMILPGKITVRRSGGVVFVDSPA